MFEGAFGVLCVGGTLTNVGVHWLVFGGLEFWRLENWVL